VDDIAYIEESIELLPQISKLVYTAIATDPEMGSLTITQGKAVALLYHQGDQTVSQVANGLGISLPAASELLDRLGERGLVDRTADPADRRRINIGLTPEALSFARRIHDLRREQVRAALAQMPRSEWPIFVKSLRVLAAALDASATADPSKVTSSGRQR